VRQLAAATPRAGAQGGGWLDDAAAGLDQGAVYVAPEISGAASLQETLLQAVPDDGSIAVVVLPGDAKLESQYTTYLLDKLFDGGDHDTLIIAIGDDLQADSRAIDGEEAMRIANEAQGDAGGDTQTALIETVQQISAEDPAPGGDSGGGPQDPGVGGVLLPVVLGAVVLAAGGAALAAVIRRRRGRPTTAGLPPALHQRTDRLRALATKYASRASTGDPIARDTATEITTLTSNIDQLFQRLDARAAADQRSIAEAEYADKLGRLTAALEEDYLLDLLVNPQLWEDPQERVQEVQDALEAVSRQLLDNIRQVNARKGLHFQVSLDSLVGREELRDWEREFKRNSES
jgi:hypothetical protein